MTKARTLADMISDGVIGTTELADDVITPVKLDETGSYIMAQLGVNGSVNLNSQTDGNDAFRVYRSDGTLTGGLYPYSSKFQIASYNNQNIVVSSSANIELNGGNVSIDGTGSSVLSLNSTTNGSQIEFDSSSTTNPWYIGVANNTGGDFLVYQNAAAGAGDFTLYTNGNERLRVAAGGQVGIGTTTPAHKLHVADATTPEIIVEDTTNGVKAVLGADNDVGRIGTDTNHPVTFRTNDTERYRIETNGDFKLRDGGNDRFGISYNGGQKVSLKGLSAPGGSDTDVLSIQTYADGNYTDRLEFSRNGAITERAGSPNAANYYGRVAKKYYWGASAFSNPTVNLMTLTASANNYPQIGIKVTVWQLGLSGNAIGINNGYVTMSYYSSAWLKSEQAFAHEFSTYNNSVNPAWSITTDNATRTATIAVLCQRKTNYDRYAISVELMYDHGMSLAWS